MGVKERILTIRLLDKVSANPAAVRELGLIQVTDPQKNELPKKER